MSNVYIPESAMAIVAHPDDIEFSFGGTIARWAKAGTRIAYVLCTSGEVGIAEPGMTKAKAIEIREAEQREAARILGVENVIFLREADGMLQATLDLRKQLVREIRRFRPEVVLTGDPMILWAGEDYINHPDHRAASTAALDAIFPAAGQPNLFEELEAEGVRAFKPRKVFVNMWSGGEVFINIEETVELKAEALRAHKSQMKEWDPGPDVKQWGTQAAKGKEMEFAEAFRVVTLVDDPTWEKTKGIINY